MEEGQAKETAKRDAFTNRSLVEGRKSLFDSYMTSYHLSNDDRSLSLPINNSSNDQQDKDAIAKITDNNNLGLGASSDSAGLTNSLDTFDSGSSVFLNFINKQEFAFGLGLLEKHKKWAQKAARKYIHFIVLI